MTDKKPLFLIHVQALAEKLDARAKDVESSVNHEKFVVRVFKDAPGHTEGLEELIADLEENYDSEHYGSKGVDKGGIILLSDASDEVRTRMEEALRRITAENLPPFRFHIAFLNSMSPWFTPTDKESDAGD